MTDQKSSKGDEYNKLALTGRIYPAIRSCVNNRYKIVLAFFAYYSFILRSDKLYDIAKDNNVNLAASILFTIFIILNSFNYGFNAYEQIKREGENGNWFWAMKIEIPFAVISYFMIWKAYSIFFLSLNK